MLVKKSSELSFSFLSSMKIIGLILYLLKGVILATPNCHLFYGNVDFCCLYSSMVIILFILQDESILTDICRQVCISTGIFSPTEMKDDNDT